MISMTPSAKKFFFDKYPVEASLLMFGHTEVLTEEMVREYIEWCKTEEGRSYLKGGTLSILPLRRSRLQPCAQR